MYSEALAIERAKYELWKSNRLKEEKESMAYGAFGGIDIGSGGITLSAATAYRYENLDSYEIHVLLPGYTANEVVVEYEKETVTVKARPCKGWTWPQIEWKHEALYNFSVPGAESVSAVLKSGVLYITAPKKVKGVVVEVKEEE
jgi:HSP20 family molecular chaperone IbpA